jgi:Tol biopolymer transport system component
MDVACAAGDFSWSCDGKTIAYLVRNEIYLFDVDSGVTTRIMEDMECSFMHWSPVEPHCLAFSAEGSLWLTDTTKPKKKSKVANITKSFSWFPDGKKIVVDDRGTIVVVNLSDRKRTAIGEYIVPASSKMDCATRPVVSGDGKKIAYAYRTVVDKGDGKSWVIANSDVFVCDVDTKKITNITDTPHHFEHLPRWSPDGKRLLINVSVDHDEGKDIPMIIDCF